MSDVHGAADPTVKLPASVVRNAARSAELVEKQRLLRSGATIPPVNGETPPVEPPVNGETPPVTPEIKRTAAELEHDYKSMKGRLEASERANRQMGQQLTDMQRLMATLQAPPPAPQPPAGKKLVTAEEETAYGPEMMDVVRRLAQEVYEPAMAELRAQITQLGGQVKGVSNSVSMSAHDQMIADLGKQIPNMEELNHDPEFLSWLDLPDPYTGAIRKQLLDSAVAAKSTSRVAAFFKGFLADKAATSPVDPTKRPSGANPPPNGLLESLAAPGRASGSGGATPPKEKPIITRAEISAFYSDLSKGVYTGRDADKNEIEQLIFGAQKEGRIR